MYDESGLLHTAQMNEQHLVNTIKHPKISDERKRQCLIQLRLRYSKNYKIHNNRATKRHIELLQFLNNEIEFFRGPEYFKKSLTVRTVKKYYKKGNIKVAVEEAIQLLTCPTGLTKKDYIKLIPKEEPIGVNNQLYAILAPKSEIKSLIDDDPHSSVSERLQDFLEDYEKYKNTIFRVSTNTDGDNEHSVQSHMSRDYILADAVVTSTSIEHLQNVLDSKNGQQTKPKKNKKQKEETMENKGTTVVDETLQAALITAGDRAYENIETVINTYVTSKLTWWQKWTISKKQKDMLILAAIYTLIHAIKTGAFGLLDKKLNHKLLDALSLACNLRIQNKLFAGIDTNVVQMLLTKPEITSTN